MKDVEMYNIEFIFGVYELVSIEAFQDDVYINEQTKSGMFTFTRDYKLSVVNSTTDWLMAYTGSFEIQSQDLVIHVVSCVITELENTVIKRKILMLDRENLILEASGSDKAKKSRITWKKVASI